jgi:hypothetical protein
MLSNDQSMNVLMVRVVTVAASSAGCAAVNALLDVNGDAQFAVRHDCQRLAVAAIAGSGLLHRMQSG